MKKMILGATLVSFGTILGVVGSIVVGASLCGMEEFREFVRETQNMVKCLDASVVNLVDRKVAEESSAPIEKSENDVTIKTYRIGAIIGPIPAPILAQIPEEVLTGDSGVFLMNVAPESPAAKAGLKEYDIITKVDGEAVNGANFVEKIKNSEGKKLSLEVLRSGKTQNMEVTPEEQVISNNIHNIPNGFQIPNMPRMIEIPGMDMGTDDGMDIENAFPEDFPMPEEVRQMLKEQRKMFRNRGFHIAPFQQNGENGQEAQIQQFGQNMNSQMRFEVTPKGTMSTRTMTSTEDGKKLTISVRKTNDEPGMILVEWNDECYEATEDNLESIPESIRPKVENFLKQNSVQLHIGGFGQIPGMFETEDEQDGNDKEVTKALAAPEEAGDAENKGDDTSKEIPIQNEKVINLK